MSNLAGQRTFLQMQNECGSIWLNQASLSTTSYPTLQTAKDLINKHYKMFVAKYPFLWAMLSATISTGSGSSLLTFPDGVRKLNQAQIRANGRYLSIIPRKTFERIFPMGWTSVGQSQPIYLVEAAPASNNAIQYDMFPIPDTAYTINYDYEGRFAQLSSDTDITVIQPEYETLLVYQAAAEGLVMLGDPRAKQYMEWANEVDTKAWLDNEKMNDYEHSIQDAPTATSFGLRPGQVLPYIA